MRLLTIILILFCFTSTAQIGSRIGLGGTAAPVNIAPVANAGVNVIVTLPTNLAGLTGSGTDADGYIAGYSWRQISGTSVTITTPLSAVTQVGIFAAAGTFNFELTVTDNVGATGKDTVSVIVNSAANIPPIAFSGPNQVITLPTSLITFVGSGTDADGTIVSYLWKKSSGTAGGTITTPSSPTSTVTGLTAGTNNYFLTVTDNNGAQSIAAMTVTVNPAAATNDGSFSFTLGSTSHTSAGVFKNDSILIKTLWNDSTIVAGTHTAYWNGTDDSGLPIISPDATYKVKVQPNNVQYTWQGTIGNTSDYDTGSTVHRGAYACMKGLVFSGSYGYFATGYSEGVPSMGKFLTSVPNQRININSDGNYKADVNFVTTDGTYVYWGAYNSQQPNNSFVYATKTSDDSFVTFSSGVNYSNGNNYSAIGYRNVTNGLISGMAVQVSGNYLFVSRASLNEVQVINKTTGALVQTLTYTNPRGLSFDGSDNLWMCSGTSTVAKYTVNVNGTLTVATLTLAGLVSPIATQASYDGTKICVVDGSTSQQVKIFNNTTGASVSTLGSAGGYSTIATVADNKFYFSDVNGQGVGQYNKQPFVAFQSDGSFWVGDAGNFRVQHYNSSNVFVNRIMSLGANYSCFADRNTPTKIFNEFLEFEVDYSVQQLTGTTGWVLKNSWGPNINVATYIGSPRYQTTLSNGRTYGFIRKGNDYEVVEFVSGGQIRFTGVIKTGLTGVLCDDGSYQEVTNVGAAITIKRFPLTGFSSNNPVWSGTSETLATGTSDNTTTGTPVTDNITYQIFSGYRVALFNPSAKLNYGATPFLGYHVATMTRGASTFLTQTEKSDHVRYGGDYPKAGWFDVGNLVNQYAGGSAALIDRNVITSYHGEFWKNGQTNKYNHYDTSGLSIGQFGVTGADFVRNTPANYGMAGNALTPVVVTNGGDSIYLYAGDESHHAAFLRWKISNLSSIAIQTITINYPTAYVAPAITYTPLMLGVPFDQALTNNTAGWVSSPAADILVNTNSNWWKAWTSVISYDWQKDNDISVEALVPTTETRTKTKDLGNNNVTTNWKITGNVNYGQNNNPNDTINGRGQYLDILDATGKTLATFYVFGKFNFPTYVRGNTSAIASGVAADMAIITAKTQPFEISCVGDTVRFTYSTYTTVSTTIFDPTANWQTPKTLRLRFVGVTGAQAQFNSIAIQNFKFYKDY